MSDRCISIYGKTFALNTGHQWDFIFTGKHDTSFKISGLQSLPFSHTMCAEVSKDIKKSRQVEKRSKIVTEEFIIKKHALMFKNDPATRKICTFDRRRKDVLLYELINDNLMIAKLKSDHDRGYWTMMDINGDYIDIPKPLQEILSDDKYDWSTLQIK